jgi:hypothetical protein
VDPVALARIAARQYGLFTRGQAGRCGFSADMIRRRLATGEWIRVLGTVLAPAGTCLTAVHSDRAAGLAVRSAVLAGSTARGW